MESISLNQAQVNQVCHALWAIADAFQYVAAAILVSAGMRALFNK